MAWKVISDMLDSRLKAEVQFHDSLHRFRQDRGTGNGTIKAKLLMQLSSVRRKTLYFIFIDLDKSYDTLDRERTSGLLEAYGLGQRACHLLRNFWGNLTVVARQRQHQQHIHFMTAYLM